MLKKLVPKFKKPDFSSKPKRIENKRKPRQIKKVEEKVLIKEEGDIAEIVIEETEETIADIKVDDLNIINLDQVDDIVDEDIKIIDDLVDDAVVADSSSHGVIVDELEENKKNY